MWKESMFARANPTSLQHFAAVAECKSYWQHCAPTIDEECFVRGGNASSSEIFGRTSVQSAVVASLQPPKSIGKEMVGG